MPVYRQPPDYYGGTRPVSPLVASMSGLADLYSAAVREERARKLEEERVKLAQREADRRDEEDRRQAEFDSLRMEAARGKMLDEDYARRAAVEAMQPGMTEFRQPAVNVDLTPSPDAFDEFGLPTGLPQGAPTSIPLSPATTTRAPRPQEMFNFGGRVGQVPLFNRDQIAEQERRKRIESGEYMEITPEVEAALAEAPPVLRSILMAGSGGLIKRSTLAGALPALAKPAPQPKTIQPVAGGYLRLNPDGSETFVRTAESGGEGGSGTLIPTTDQTGAIVGFYNNRTGAFQPAQLPPGTRRSGVPAGEMAQRGMLESIISDADTLATLAEGDAGAYIGPVTGQWTGATRGFRDLPPDVNDLFHIADNLADMLLRARSGAQINEQEYRRLRALVPNPRDSRSKFDADLNRFRIESRNILSARQGGPVTQAPPPNTGAPDATVDRSSFPGAAPKRGDRKTARNGVRLVFDGVGWIPEGRQ